MRTREKLSEEEKLSILAAYARGEVLKSIAQTHGISIPTIYNLRRASGMPPRRLKGEQMDRQMAFYLSAGLYDQITEQAAKERISMARLMRRIAQNYIDDQRRGLD